MKIERFENINARKKARVLANAVFAMARENKKLQTRFRFREQLTSSAVSVTANIAEGFPRRSNKEFRQFLPVAKASIPELRSHLYITLDQELILKDKFSELYEQTDKAAKLAPNFITCLLKRK